MNLVNHDPALVAQHDASPGDHPTLAEWLVMEDDVTTRLTRSAPCVGHSRPLPDEARRQRCGLVIEMQRVNGAWQPKERR